MKSKIDIDQGWKNFAKQYCEFEGYDTQTKLDVIDIICKEANSIYRLTDVSHIQIRAVKLQKLAEISTHCLIDKHINARLAFLKWCLT